CIYSSSISVLFSPVLNGFFQPGTFWLFAGITVVGVIFMVFLLPETKDKTLEEVEQLFMNKQELEDLASSRNPQQTKS
ncbi:facilitated trehalose transporter tret1, partial [Plakobranchus ocellatus]